MAGNFQYHDRTGSSVTLICRCEVAERREEGGGGKRAEEEEGEG